MKSRIILALAVLLLAAPAAQADLAWLQEAGDAANTALAASGSDLRLAYAEVLTDADEQGVTVFFFNVGNKQLSSDWVPFDPRREWNTTGGITYLVDQSDGATASGLINADTEGAIDRAMQTWDFATTCSNTPMFKVADPGDDPDLVDALLGFGPPPGPGFPYADIVHGGWTPAFPPPTLGVTFTFIWTSGGVPTDIDNNGKTDTAIREIYYSDNFVWNIGANIDVETVALHEAGHGLSQAHFGKLFRTDANGKFHFAPLAVMNAGYTQVQQDLKATDLSGHCSLWGDWPNN
ncbi:MAG TPA: hypothetical protein VMT85_10355 [Thermoanaerobaculia bacterium]|nr:hypothetical protein [Thermoanaerobaculia bacterium]